MQAALKKLVFKGQRPVLVLGAPPEAAALVKALGASSEPVAKGKAAFVLAFARSLAEADSFAKAMARALADGGVFWMAYPKGTSKKHKGADINRDKAHEQMAGHGFEGVSLVALDEDWSAMRFKRPR
jgi:hypothetical protein